MNEPSTTGTTASSRGLGGQRGPAAEVGLSRRAVLRGAAAAAVGLAAPAVLARPAHALAGFPTFTYLREAFSRDDLDYNPTDELIFPSIRKMRDHAPDPLGDFYLYYSPHDAPGGICVAYSDFISGPFTEYAGNPIISRNWAPHYNVSHVASPHVLWNESNATFYMYFHGENNTTRLARSADGITWTYDSVVLTTAQLPSSTETSYARVFRHTIPSKNNVYVMLFMGNQAGTRRIFLAWSNDQRRWTVRQTPLVNPEPDGEEHVAGAMLALKNGEPHILYQGSSGPMYITRVGKEFTGETHLGIFHQPLQGFPDNGRSAHPVIAEKDGKVYMYYAAGQRLDGRIAIARGNAVSGVTWPL